MCPWFKFLKIIKLSVTYIFCTKFLYIIMLSYKLTNFVFGLLKYHKGYCYLFFHFFLWNYIISAYETELRICTIYVCKCFWDLQRKYPKCWTKIRILTIKIFEYSNSSNWIPSPTIRCARNVQNFVPNLNNL